MAFALSLRMDTYSLECTPGVPLIALECGWSERGVQTAIRELRDKGYLWVQYRGSGYAQQSNLYRGLFPAWAGRQPARVVRNEPGF